MLKKNQNFTLYGMVAIILTVFVIMASNWESVNLYIKKMEFTLQGKLIAKDSTLFSWTINEETSQILQSQQNKLHITRVYQYIKPLEFTNGILDSYICEMKEKSLSVYAMDGAYYWGTTDYGYDEYLSFVDSVYTYNLSHENHKIDGIVLDVEPAQDPEWNNSEDALMTKFVENMICAYVYAEKKNLEVVICIPNWYDEKHENQLRKLVELGCDEIAVMNYSCEKEIEKVKTEVSIAEEYGKRIINIFEFTEPDNEVVFNQNTYYEKGVKAAVKVFKRMDNYYNYNELTVGWHQLTLESVQ